MSDTYALFTHDLVDLIIEKSRQAKEARDESNGDFEIVEHGECDPCWVAYLVASK